MKNRLPDCIFQRFPYGKTILNANETEHLHEDTGYEWTQHAVVGASESQILRDTDSFEYRGETSFTNEPYVTGGNPVLSSKDGVMFNDMLGSTLNIGGKAVNMTAFGETANANAMYTGKPYIGELGYAFLFRNYRSDYGKWGSSSFCEKRCFSSEMQPNTPSHFPKVQLFMSTLRTFLNLSRTRGK